MLASQSHQNKSCVFSTKLLKKELNTASNIKNRSNRGNVERVLKIILEKLKTNLSNENGIFIFAGITKDKNEIIEIIYPPIPSFLSFYKCDNKFHVDIVKPFFKSDEKSILLILIYGTYFLICECFKNQIIKIYDHDALLIKRQGRGGSSQHRFENLASESRIHYVSIVADKIHSIMLSTERKNGIVIAGSRELSTDLCNHLNKHGIECLNMDYFHEYKKGILNQNMDRINSIIHDVYSNNEEQIKVFLDDFYRNSDLYLVGSEEIKEHFENVESILRLDSHNKYDKKEIIVPINSRYYGALKGLGGLLAKKYY